MKEEYIFSEINNVTLLILCDNKMLIIKINNLLYIISTFLLLKILEFKCTFIHF